MTDGDDPRPDDVEPDTVWLSQQESTRPVDLQGQLDLDERRYTVQRALGVGGMGEVSLCRDRRIGRDVALKVVRTDIASPAARRAFVSEARVQAQLEHPSIIPVYDIGIDEHGGEYFTMRAIAGTTLTEVIRRLRAGDEATTKEFTRLRLLDAFRQVCQAVEYAHEKGVIHRDLKPANVMLGEYGEVYVLDWGLAQLHGAPTEAPDARAPVLGTPGYIAPEQTIVGGLVDRGADIYALGAILFEILSLQRMHVGKDSAEILASTRAGHAARAQLRAPDRDIPPELEAVCERATTVDPRERFANVRELVDAIDAFLEGHRNQSMRRDLAARHADQATTETTLALTGGHGAEPHRRRALQEIARALALDPDNRSARRSLIQLVAEPPRELPAEVVAEIERGVADEGRFAARLGAFAYAAFVLVALVTLFQGLRSPIGLAVVAGSVGLAAIWCVRLSRRFIAGEGLGAFVVSSIAIATASGFYGPLIMVPVLAAANTTAFNFATVRRYRLHILVLGCLTFLVPAVAEWVGLIDPAYVFDHGAIMVVPRFIEFDETMVRVALVVVNIAALVAPTIVVWKIADTKDELRRKYVIQSWQMRQLVAD